MIWLQDKNPDNREAAEAKFKDISEAYEVGICPSGSSQHASAPAAPRHLQQIGQHTSGVLVLTRMMPSPHAQRGCINRYVQLHNAAASLAWAACSCLCWCAAPLAHAGMVQWLLMPTPLSPSGSLRPAGAV